MGSSESTGRLNGTERNEEEQPQESGGGSTGAGTITIAIAAGVAVVWAGTTPVAIAAGVAAAWGISTMLFNNKDTDTETETETDTDTDTDTKEKDEESRKRRISIHGIEPSLPNLRIRTNYTEEGSNRWDQQHSEAKSTKKISIWFPPPPGVFKMNTDAGFRPTKDFLQNDVVKQPSAYAGILRDDCGECIKAFRHFYIGVTDCLEAEIVGILKGLELLVELGLKGAILESDSDEAVLWVKGEKKSYKNPKERMKGLIDRCRKLCRKNSITINNIDRSANKCADKLASLALGEQYPDVQTDLPGEVKKLVNDDKTAYISWL